MRLAKRLERLGTETAFEVLAVVNKLKEEGRNILSFAIGEPDFDTPKNIVEAAVNALQSGKTHYTPSAGITELRRAVAKYVARTRSIEVSPEEVIITPGGKPIIFYAMLACIDEGDEVIYPNPGYPIYESMINFVGGKAVPLPLLEEKGFSFDVEELKRLVNEKTKMIVLNSPQNPTGGILSQEDLEAIAELAQKHDFWILSDEIYSRLVYDSEFKSISSLPGMKERTIILDGHSKTYAMTGWRLGYGVMRKDLAEQVAKLITNSVSCTATFTQIAGIEALEGPQEEAEAMAKEFKERRDLIVEGLNSIEGFKCHKPGGAFYVFPNVTEACKNLGFKNSKELQEYLLHKANVAVLHRECFGMRNEGETQEYLRLSYATSKEDIQKGLEMIKNAVENKELAQEFLSEREN